MFWDKFISMCNDRNTTPTAVVSALHISIGSITKWKNGTIPNDTTILKISDYFGVSPDFFTESENSTIDTISNDELSEYLEELKNRPEMRMLFSLAKGATKEDVEQAVAIIEVLRKRGKYG